MIDLIEHATTLLRTAHTQATTVHRGLSDVVLVTLADGRKVIVKSGPYPRAEASMLRHLLRAGTPVPHVLAVNSNALVLNHLPHSPSTDGGWADLGRALARLHRTTGPAYGWVRGYAFGDQAINNRWSEDWPTFWADRRLRPGLDQLPTALRERLAALCDRLDTVLPSQPRASLLHGDLWAGNIIMDGDHLSGLIDPACYFGHYEVDLAMLTLFSSPPVAFFAAYGAMSDGWPIRCAVYQLWPALVHVRLFGSGYLPMVTNLLNQIDQISTP